MTGWPANPKLVRHLKSTLIRTGVHVDEAVMGLSVHTNGDGAGENPLLQYISLIGNRDNAFEYSCTDIISYNSTAVPW